MLAVLGFFQAILAAAKRRRLSGFDVFTVNAIILLGLSGWLAHYVWTTRKEEATAPAAAVPSGAERLGRAAHGISKRALT